MLRPCVAMENNEFLYETLSPLGADKTPSPPPLRPTPTSSSSKNEPYVVLRNQISVNTFKCPSPESAAPDYFSLEVNEAVDKETSISATLLPFRETGETSAPASEKTFEGNWFRAYSRFKSPMLRLHKEILDFCEFLSPTPEEQESRTAAIKSVFDVINYIWPNAVAEIFGSFETGLYLPSSDIDVVILGSNVRSPQIGLQALSRALSQRGIAKKMQVIAKARVPIIKFVEKKSGFAFDIRITVDLSKPHKILATGRFVYFSGQHTCFDVHNGPKAAEFIKDAVAKWPPLKPLCLILKVFLQQRELNEVYTGGIGSYALLSMLIAMLRTRKDNQASPERNLGVLLVNFFDMYGCKLNTVDVGVSCNGEGTFFQKYNKGFSVEGRPSLIAIEDPQAPDNDIGKNSFNYYQARSAFAMAFTTLTNTKAIIRLGSSRSILSAIIRPDAVLLERKGGSNGKLTFGNLFPDVGEPLEQLFGDQQELYCNWTLNGVDEEPLPRGNGIGGDNEVKSWGKKRKASKEKRSSKKVKSHENDSGKESRANKRSSRRSQNGAVNGIIDIRNH